jgi:serine/threonine protein kinase
MGEVYRARDTKLQRDVAIKVLSAVLAQNGERLMRFKCRSLRSLANFDRRRPGTALVT